LSKPANLCKQEKKQANMDRNLGGARAGCMRLARKKGRAAEVLQANRVDIAQLPSSSWSNESLRTRNEELISPLKLPWLEAGAGSSSPCSFWVYVHHIGKTSVLGSSIKRLPDDAHCF